MANKDSGQIRVLLVEDDINLGYLMEENLEAKGINVTLAKTGKEGMDAIAKADYDLCIFDIMLPETDGFKLATKLRATRPATPFIFVTARMQEADKLNGFEAGADDYITKPFSFKELYYRIMVILKRMNVTVKPIEHEQLSVGNLVLDTQARTLNVNGSEKLSRREADVLSRLMHRAGNYVSRSEILKQVWGTDDYFTAKSMDVYMTRIRKLLKDEPSLEIENLYGTGYRIRCNNNP